MIDIKAYEALGFSKETEFKGETYSIDIVKGQDRFFVKSKETDKAINTLNYKPIRIKSTKFENEDALAILMETGFILLSFDGEKVDPTTKMYCNVGVDRQ